MAFIHQNPPLYTAWRKDVTEHWKRALIIGWVEDSAGDPKVPDLWPIILRPGTTHGYCLGEDEIAGFYGSELEANVAIKELNA